MDGIEHDQFSGGDAWRVCDVRQLISGRRGAESRESKITSSMPACCIVCFRLRAPSSGSIHGFVHKKVRTLYLKMWTVRACNLHSCTSRRTIGYDMLGIAKQGFQRRPFIHSFTFGSGFKSPFVSHRIESSQPSLVP